MDSIYMDNLSKVLLQVESVRQKLAHIVSEQLKAVKKSEASNKSKMLVTSSTKKMRLK